jgi:hypothetical protein
VGFRGERKRYLDHLAAAAGNLPAGLAKYAHRIAWPLKMDNPLAHITCYFGEPGYSEPRNDPRHLAVDIQLPLGTPIVAPEKATVVMVDGANPINEHRGFSDLLLYSEKSGIAYWLAHLDTASLPAKIRRRHWFDKWSEVEVQRGKPVGFVGEFFSERVRRDYGKSGLDRSVKVPEDVLSEYGRSYDHLHLEAHYCPDVHDLSYCYNNPVDPLLLFERLYR